MDTRDLETARLEHVLMLEHGTLEPWWVPETDGWVGPDGTARVDGVLLVPDTRGPDTIAPIPGVMVLENDGCHPRRYRVHHGVVERLEASESYDGCPEWCSQYHRAGEAHESLIDTLLERSQCVTVAIVDAYGYTPDAPAGWKHLASYPFNERECHCHGQPNEPTGAAGDCDTWEYTGDSSDPARPDCPLCEGTGNVYQGEGAEHVYYCAPWDVETTDTILADLIRALHDVRTDAQSYDPAEIDGGDGPSIDVRIQVDADGSWSLHTGDSQYDQDHRGHWGASSVSPDDGDSTLEDTARDLIDQALESWSEAYA